MNRTRPNEVAVELIAVIVAVTDGEPRVLTIDDGGRCRPGRSSSTIRPLQSGMRSWVERQTHHPLGYVEQLYTFADRDRDAATGQRMVSISYLGLTREVRPPASPESGWQSWYRYFPWEDWRSGAPRCWRTRSLRGCGPGPRRARTPRPGASGCGGSAITFGHDGGPGTRSWSCSATSCCRRRGWCRKRRQAARAGRPVPAADAHDHRRILATGIARLRAKIKYRPVVFELMPPRFTLLQLQRAVEALAGRRLHKQNFRRLIEQQDLVEETGEMSTETGGRPAKLFRFRREVVLERAVAGSKLPLARSA